MVATPGTIPALTPYQPGNLPITGQELIEIASSNNASTAISASMQVIDVVGKSQNLFPGATAGNSDVLMFFQTSSGLAKSTTFGTLFNTPFFATQVNDGTVSSGTATLSVAAGPYHRLTIGALAGVAFTAWPASGVYAQLEIELINGGVGVTWPTVNWLKGDGTNNTAFSSMAVTLNTTGTNWVIVWSRDGGTTLWGKAA